MGKKRGLFGKEEQAREGPTGVGNSECHCRPKGERDPVTPAGARGSAGRDPRQTSEPREVGEAVGQTSGTRRDERAGSPRETVEAQ